MWRFYEKYTSECRHGFLVACKQLVEGLMTEDQKVSQSLAIPSPGPTKIEEAGCPQSKGRDETLHLSVHGNTTRNHKSITRLHNTNLIGTVLVPNTRTVLSCTFHMTTGRHPSHAV
jgi:hypothetical protein